MPVAQRLNCALAVTWRYAPASASGVSTNLRSTSSATSGRCNVADEEVKPPLGLEPEAIWRGKRLAMIIEALTRQRENGRSITQGAPLDWSKEAGELATWFLVRQESSNG